MKYVLFLPLLILTLFSPLFATRVAAQESFPTIFYCVGSNLAPPCVTVAPTEPPVTNPTAIPTTPAGTTVSPTNENGTPAEPTSSAATTTPSASASPTVDPCQSQTTQSTTTTQSTVTIQSKEKEKNDDNKKKSHPKKHSHPKKGLLQQLLEFLLKLIQTLLQFIGLQLPGSAVPCPQPTPQTGSVNEVTPGISAEPTTASGEGAIEDPTPTIFN